MREKRGKELTRTEKTLPQRLTRRRAELERQNTREDKIKTRKITTTHRHAQTRTFEDKEHERKWDKNADNHYHAHKHASAHSDIERRKTRARMR